MIPACVYHKQKQHVQERDKPETTRDRPDSESQCREHHRGIARQRTPVDENILR